MTLKHHDPRRVRRIGWGVAAALLCAPALSLAPVTAAGAGPSLSDRVLRPNELAGFAPANVQTVKDVNAWAKIAPNALVNVAAHLRSEGFVVAVREDLSAQTTDRGALSIVVQLRTPAAAKKELGLQRRDYANEPHTVGDYTTFFHVSGIPGAYGFTATDGSHSHFGANVIFADGRFVYHVGAGWGAGANNPPTKQQVVAAAHHLYERVHSP